MIKNRYSGKLEDVDKEDFSKNLKIIDKQIKQIENLVNEFSDFARMPKPIFKNNNLISIINENIDLLKTFDINIQIDLNYDKDEIILNSDYEQLSRVFFNLIKNSIESIQEEMHVNKNLIGKIDIQIHNNIDYINFIIADNGVGFAIFANNLKDILNPYFTTKKKGTGLGLAIVNKIINDHDGSIDFIPLDRGAKIQIKFKKR